MADQIEEIKKKIDIIELINEFVPLKKAGRNFVGLCPFHSEKTPSFAVSPERQRWHCFGACNDGGDIFSFLMKIENIEFGEALRILANRAGVKLISYRPTDAERQKQLFFEVNHLAAEYYHYLLLNHPVGKKALDYVLGRGVSKESLETFQIGYAPDMWDGLQKFMVGKKKYRPDILEKVGLIIGKDRGGGRIGYIDRFRNRVVFPLRNHRGDVCGFSGRIIGPSTGQFASPKYINSPETPIYHKSELLYGLYEVKEEIKKADSVILTEGELDMISSYQAGIKNTVAIKGSALTADQVKLLSRFTRNIVFALDSDSAGDKADRRGVEIADAGGMAVKIIEITGGKDPDEVAQKSPAGWQKMVLGAVPAYDYFINSAFARFDSRAVDGKRKIGQELTPIFAKINDSIIQSHYIKVLAERLGVEYQAVFDQAQKEAKQSPGASIASAFSQAGTEKHRREILEEHLVGICLQTQEWSKLRKRRVINLIKTPRFAEILVAVGEYLRKYKTIKNERLAKMLPPELTDTLDKLYLKDFGDVVSNEEKFAFEFDESCRQLEEFDLRENLKEISSRIRTLENKPDLSDWEAKELDKLTLEFSELSKKLNIV